MEIRRAQVEAAVSPGCVMVVRRLGVVVVGVNSRVEQEDADQVHDQPHNGDENGFVELNRLRLQ